MPEKAHNGGMALLVTVIVLSFAAVLAVASVSMLVGASRTPSDRAAFTQAHYAAGSAESAALVLLSDDPAAEGSFGVFDLVSAGNVARAQYMYSIEEVGEKALFVDASPAASGATELWHYECSGALTVAGAGSSRMGMDLKPADLDGSGHYDAVAGAGGDEFAVFKGRGGGRFAYDAVYAAGGEVKCFLVADVSGDGAFDIILGTGEGCIEIWLNDGAGGFSMGAAYDAGGIPYSVAMGDLNGSGDLDIVLGVSSGAAEVWLNDGAGGFSIDASYSAGGIPYSIVLGDLNGSGELDIVLGVSSGAAEVWLNDGAGEFSRNPLEDTYPLEGGAVPVCVALADMNGENGPDIVAGTDTGRIAVWLNDGEGKFWINPEPPEGPGQNVSYYDLIGAPAVSLALSAGEYPDIMAGTGEKKIEILQNSEGEIQDSQYFECARVRARRLPVKKINAVGYYPSREEYNARVRGMPRARRSSVIYAVIPGDEARVLAGHSGSF